MIEKEQKTSKRKTYTTTGKKRANVKQIQDERKQPPNILTSNYENNIITTISKKGNFKLAPGQSLRMYQSNRDHLALPLLSPVSKSCEAKRIVLVRHTDLPAW